MSRLLIDLTDLKLWNGNHGGTQRVVYNISKYFYLEAEGLEQNIEFISFSSRDNAFHSTEFAPIYEKVESQSIAQVTHAGSGLSLKTRLKSRLRPYVPGPIRKNLKLRQMALKSLSKGVSLT